MSDSFFIGWSGRTGPALGRFLTAVALAFTLGLGLLGLGLGGAANRPTTGIVGLAPVPDPVARPPEPREAHGLLLADPVPMLLLAPGAGHPSGETLLLAGFDKRGTKVPEGLAGRMVATKGTLFYRGDIAMLIGDGAFTPTAGKLTPETTPLGRWRIAGEICDGKCYAGIMRPGNGLAHRACASLCFLGDVPLVFVAPEPVEGSAFFILGDIKGGPPPDAARRFIGVPVALEGTLERRGSALIFRADFAKARIP